jgi:hypothetical protein
VASYKDQVLCKGFRGRHLWLVNEEKGCLLCHQEASDRGLEENHGGIRLYLFSTTKDNSAAQSALKMQNTDATATATAGPVP